MAFVFASLSRDEAKVEAVAPLACPADEVTPEVGVTLDADPGKNFLNPAAGTSKVTVGIRVPKRYRKPATCEEDEVPSSGTVTITLPPFLSYVRAETNTPGTVSGSGQNITFTHDTMSDGYPFPTGGASVTLIVDRPQEPQSLPEVPETGNIAASWTYSYPSTGSGGASGARNIALTYSQMRVSTTRTEPVGPGDIIPYSVRLGGYPHFDPVSSKVRITAPNNTEFVEGSISASGSVTFASNVVDVDFGSTTSQQTVGYSLRVKPTLPPYTVAIEPFHSYTVVVRDPNAHVGTGGRLINLTGSEVGRGGRVYVRPLYEMQWIAPTTAVALNGELPVKARFTNISSTELTNVQLASWSLTYAGEGLGQLVTPVPPAVALSPGQSAEIEYKFKATRVGKFKVTGHAEARAGSVSYFSIPTTSPEFCVECSELEFTISVPEKRFEVGDQFPAVVKVKTLREEPLTITFNDPLLKEKTESGLPEDNILSINPHDLPPPFELNPTTPSKEFVVMVMINELGATQLTSSLSYQGPGDIAGEATALKKVSAPPFEVDIQITPKQTVMNQTPSSKKSERCREIETNSTTIKNCIEIVTTVRNDSDRPITNITIPNAENPLTLINEVDPRNPGEPLTEIEHQFPPTPVNLQPGQEATWVWRMNAFDAPAVLEFEPTVFGVQSGLEVGGHGNKKFQVLQNVLLKWGMRPTDGRTSQPSGQPIRADGYIENVSAADGGEEKLLRVLVYQMPEKNAGGGFVYKASADGGESPTAYEIFDLPATGDNKRLDVKSLFRTARMEHTTTGLIRFGVRLWIVDEEGKLTSATEQAQLDDEGYTDEFSMLLTPSAMIYDQYVENCLAKGFKPILCSFNQSFAGEFADGMFGLFQFGLSGLESGGEAVARTTVYKIWAQREMMKAVLGDTAARQRLNQELYVQYLTFHQLGVLSGQVAGQAPMAFEAFSIQMGDGIGNYLRAIDEGDMTSLQEQTGKFFGANPDLLFEPLMVAASFAKMSKAMRITEAGMADNLYTAAARQQAIKQEASIEARLAAAGNRSEDLASALAAGDKLTPSILRRVFGISDTQVKRLHDFCKDNQVILAFRSRSRLAQTLLDTNIAWPKPMAFKHKTINEIDIRFLGYRRRAEARIEIIEPPAMLKNVPEEQLNTVLDQYMTTLKNQNPELAQNKVLFEETRGRMKTRVKEWNKYNPELRLENLEEEVTVGVNFGLNDQMTKDVGEIGVKEQRKVHRIPVESVTDQVDGSTRRVWEIKMEGPNGGDPRYITGDIDFLAILDKYGRVIDDPDKRIALYTQLQEFMEHGESFTYRYQQLRADAEGTGGFLDCCIEGVGESMITVGPWDGPPVAGYFVKNLSVMENFNAAFRRVRRTEDKVDDAGKVVLDANGNPVQVEIRHEDPTGEYLLINGTPLLNNADKAFVSRFRPLLFEIVYQDYLSRLRYYFPNFIARMLDDDTDPMNGFTGASPYSVSQANIRVGGPVVQPAGASEISFISPNSFRMWTPENGWKAATRDEVIAAGDPGVPDLAPTTAVSDSSSEGAISMKLVSTEELGVQGTYFTQGDVVVINPGGLTQETATILKSDPTVFLTPLLHAHGVGEMVVVIGHVETRGFSVSGRITTNLGRPIAQAIVTMTDQFGTTRNAVTNTLGYYRIDMLPADGSEYSLTVRSRRYEFQTQLVTMTGDVSVNFVSDHP
ncbi:MAG TPA: carboxypeptidase-like regulatory domain-containing protein [Pyrinomonadaceae bacterium]|nr:carboxypeptidase-like regulatory domain-containing protein [Pyrinomonadaceae bacterium]